MGFVDPVWFRVAVAAFCAVAPSLLFLGLWHGLHRIRDDHLVDRVLNDASGEYVTPGIGPGLLFPRWNGDPDAGFVACGECGTPNVEGTRYCHECLERL